MVTVGQTEQKRDLGCLFFFSHISLVTEILLFWTAHHFDISSANGWIVKMFCPNIHSMQMMYPTDSGDPLTVPVAPPAGQMFHLFREIIQHILAGLEQDFADIHGPQMMLLNDFD